ncbi:uncharacterized protein LOC107262375 [Ricinus communis]|uniref:uncharacterized protein LOC107262375 n=1 Tax=Ricinus communis TaxID=3988 RepID=UPI00077255D6|nr:uncharacterized protein LOC107262375 [Ricinus communis]|eukprot:XP_015583303.1 uncharacterized protein LOC107262375 [Ricinus communis]
MKETGIHTSLSWSCQASPLILWHDGFTSYGPYVTFGHQITGANQVTDALSATLHHQIIYRLQDHAFNLQIPGFQASSDALFIMVDSGQIPTIVQAPRQLEREDLQKLIPTEWVTNYEKLQASQAKPVQGTDPLFVTQKDGTVKIIFTKIEESSSAPSIFQASMIQPVSRPREKIPIHSFQSSGHHIYTARIKGHFI